MSGLLQDPTTNLVPSTRRTGVRSMHESTFTLTDSSETNYVTVMNESYSGRDSSGQPLIFFFREPQFPSQHDRKLDLSNTSTTYASTHSRDVHCPKNVIPHSVLQSYRLRNWTRSHEGLAMKEVTNPSGSTLYQSSYRDSHQEPSSTIWRGVTALGHPTTWHSHDILTGNEKAPAGPGKARTIRDESLWAQRRWETDSSALRLY